MARALCLSAFTVSLALLSCNRAGEPQRASGTTGSAAAADPDPRVPFRPNADVLYDPPATWTKVANPSPMRKATYTIPRAPGDAEDGELSVSQAGGGIDQNLTRWAGQFDQKLADVKREERTTHSLKVVVVEIHGTYKAMAMPGAPPPAVRTGQALLGAIVATSPPTFFKLTGPEKTVVAARHDFDQLVSTLRSK